MVRPGRQAQGALRGIWSLQDGSKSPKPRPLAVVSAGEDRTLRRNKGGHARAEPTGTRGAMEPEAQWPSRTQLELKFGLHAQLHSRRRASRDKCQPRPFSSTDGHAISLEWVHFRPKHPRTISGFAETVSPTTANQLIVPRAGQCPRSKRGRDIAENGSNRLQLKDLTHHDTAQH